MRCFNHPTHDAAGVCRNCGRGLCFDCIAISDGAVACKGQCEARVAAIQRMVQNNQLTYRTAAGQMRQAGVYSVFAGLLFMVMGGIFLQFVGADFGRYLGASFVIFGILILIRGASQMWASRSYTKLAQDASDQPSRSTLEHFK